MHSTFYELHELTLKSTRTAVSGTGTRGLAFYPNCPPPLFKPRGVSLSNTHKCVRKFLEGGRLSLLIMVYGLLLVEYMYELLLVE